MNDNDQQKQNTPSNISFGGYNKEKEPIRTAPGESYLTEIGKEQEISQEVKQAGVVQRQENIEVPIDMQQMGVRPTGISTPVPFKPTLKLPITDEKIEKGLHKSIINSLRWLAEWCFFQLKRVHLTLKVIKGVVRRVRA